MGDKEVSEQKPAFDATRKYVRVCNRRENGFVEFEFAIGDPALCVELMLPSAAFHEFCLANEVIMLDPVAEGSGDWVARMNEASRRDIEDAV